MVTEGDRIRVNTGSGYAILQVKKHFGNRIYIETIETNWLDYSEVSYIKESDLESENFEIE